MSVTFYCPALPEVVVSEEPCDCAWCRDTEAYALMPDAQCPWCHGTGTWRTLEHDGTFNMSNTNAAEVLEAVGLRTPDLGGEVAGEKLHDLARRVTGLLNREGLVDEARPLSVTHGAMRREVGDDGVVRIAPGPTMIACPRPEGYVAMRLGQLRDLAIAAAQAQGTLVWY